MTRLEIRPFSDEFLPARGRAPRGAPPRSPGGRAAAPGQVRRAPRLRQPRSRRSLGAEGASGAVALRGTRVRRLPARVRRGRRPIWGANVWVETRRTCRRGRRGSPRPLRRGGRALGRGGPRPPLRDRPGHGPGLLLDAWSRVGFGQQHALRDPRSSRRPPGRRASASPTRAISMPSSSWRRSSRPPGALAGLRRRPAAETEEELRADILEDLANPEIGDLVAERDGRIVGAFQIVPVELSSVHSGLARPDGAALLGWAATRPGRSRLGRRARSHRRLPSPGRASAGTTTMVTDWRVTNLLASRFWPARGFRESFLRLYRRIP